MRSRSDQSTDGTEREAGEHDRFEEPRYEEEDESRFSYLRSWGSGGTWGMWPGSSTDDEPEEFDTTEPTESYPDEERRTGGGISVLPGGSRTTALIVGGAVLVTIVWLINRAR